MTLIETWAQTPLMQALGGALLHSVWQGAVIAALLGVVLVLTRRADARYTAAAVAMLLMPIVFAVTFWLLWNVDGGLVSAETFPKGAFRGALSSATGTPSPGLDWQSWLLANAGWAAPFWLLGVAASSLRRLAAWRTSRSLRTSGAFPAPAEWTARLRDLARRIGVQTPSLCESIRIDAPAVTGWLKPVILVPAGFFAACPPEQVELILMHELAHIRRQDYLAAALAGLVESLFFFHPAVWWAAGVMRREREHCCDDMVVVHTGKAHAYASALAGLERMRAIPEPTLGATQGDLLARVRRLFTREERGTPLAGAGIGLALAAVAACVWMSHATPAEAQQQTGSAYQKWLEQDVLYIIENQERETFLRLGSDAERARFIEQFWERRDPTPGTPTNGAKEEHYRRVAYSNQRYAVESTPGWRTERGRIYIIHGPPDEIEAHPKGGLSRDGKFENPNEYEIWNYRGLGSGGQDLHLTFVMDPVSRQYRLLE